MCNTHLRDKNLSLKAKGLLSMMLSLPDKWHYSVKGLEGICKESKNTINSVLNELEDNNYLVRRRRYCNGKISEWEYIIFENNENHDEELLHLKNEDIENEDIEIQDIENRDVYKITKELSTNRLNTKEQSKHKYGEYQHVLLTDKEHTHLVELYGSSLDEHIKILDEYIETSGKSYKNHSLVLQKWVHDEWTKRNKNKPVKLDSKFYTQENTLSDEDLMKEFNRVRREMLRA
jgi:hypothetical protein